MKKIYKYCGFTAIEVLMVIGIISIVMATMIPSYVSVKRNVVLNTNVENLITDIQGAREKSVVSQDGISHGIYFDNDSYTLFGGNWSAPEYIKSHVYDSGIETINGAGIVVMFDRLTGNSVSTDVSVGFNNGDKIDININGLGLITHS